MAVCGGLPFLRKQPSEPRIRHERKDLEVDQTGPHRQQFSQSLSTFSSSNKPKLSAELAV
jgi:hypothetical protein